MNLMSASPGEPVRPARRLHRDGGRCPVCKRTVRPHRCTGLAGIEPSRSPSGADLSRSLPHHHPIHLFDKTEKVNRSQERLGRHPPYRSRQLQEARDATVRHTLVFGAYAQPDVSWQRQAQGPDFVSHPVGPLGENLVGVVVSLQHDVPHLAQVVVGDVLVEQVGHAVDEHVGRLPPPEGFVEPSRAQGDVEPLGPTAAAAEPFGDAKRVTVVAPRAHLN